MSFDVLREWELEAFAPGIDYFPETATTTSRDIVTAPAIDKTAVPPEATSTENTAILEDGALPDTETSIDSLASEGNLDFDITDAIEAQWAAESALRAQEDRDDLERERGGVGKKHERFGIERSDGGINGRQAMNNVTTDMMMNAIQQQQDRLNEIEIESFEASDTGSGFQFIINGLEFELTDEEITTVARTQSQELRQRASEARENGEDPAAIQLLIEQAEAYEELERLLEENTPESRAAAEALMLGNTFIQESIYEQEAERANTVQNQFEADASIEIKTGKHTVTSSDVSEQINNTNTDNYDDIFSNAPHLQSAFAFADNNENLFPLDNPPEIEPLANEAADKSSFQTNINSENAFPSNPWA